MAIQEKKLTIDEFWELAQRSEYENEQLELVDGEVFVMSPSSSRNSEIGGAILTLLRIYVLKQKIGRVTGADGGYQLSENTVLVPDVGFIQHDRVPDEEFVYFPVAPDLAVEIISPSETRPGVLQKSRMYLEAGTQVVWNVYPTGQTVDVVTLDEAGQLKTDPLTTKDTISGDPAVPGFEAKVSDFFL